MRRTIALAATVIALAFGSARASQGDILLDASPSATFHSISGVSNPSLGGLVAVNFGFNDATYFGLFGNYEHAGGRDDGPSLQWFTTGAQSWLDLFPGDIRPQVGGRIGFTTADGYSSLHLSAQARAVAEFETGFRLFAGGCAGGDLGDHGRSLARIEFGAQFLLR